MIAYPLTFEVSSQVPSGIASPWKTGVDGADRSLTAAIPPEFEGPGGGYSPEDFYALACLNCFAATFKVVAEKSRLEYGTLELKGRLTVDRDEQGRPWMKLFHFDIAMTGAADVERARRLLEKTSQMCLILNSVKTEKTFAYDVR